MKIDMAPQTATNNRTYHCNGRIWFTCLAIAAVPFYAMTLYLIGRSISSEEDLILSSSAAHNLQLSQDARSAASSIKRYDPLLRKDQYSAIARDVAAKWNLTSPPYLLEQQFYRVNDYNATSDFLYFHHIQKSGGTTISDIMNATLGIQVHGNRGILPGSQRSGFFDEKDFFQHTDINHRRGHATKGTQKDTSFPHIASYSHTRLRPIHGPNKTKLASFFEKYFALPHNSHKRIRSLGMLREPMDLLASSHAMAMCALNRMVINFNVKRTQKGLERICTPEEGLNISALIDEVVHKASTLCPPNGPKDMSKLNKYEQMICKRGRNALNFCRSPSHFLSSGQYNQVRSILNGLMARYTADQQMGLHHISVEKHLEQIGLGFSVEKVEEYTLVDLGGLDADIMHTSYSGYSPEQKGKDPGSTVQNANNAEPDFLWFGITERMKESTCLFYYTLNLTPLPKTPTERVMKCSPTSWWTMGHREVVQRKEPADYAVWRAANAILDIRVIKMKDDIQQRLSNEQALSQHERDQYTSLVDAGCLD